MSLEYDRTGRAHGIFEGVASVRFLDEDSEEGGGAS
jgi:hypothetical protein